MSAKNKSTQPPEAKPEPEEKKSRQRPPLPLMLEFSLSVSRIAIISLGIVTALLSVFAGAPAWMVGARSAISMLGLGLIFWLVNWVLSRDALEGVRQELQVEYRKATHSSANAGSHTMEKEA